MPGHLAAPQADALGKVFRCPWRRDDERPSAALYKGPTSPVFLHDSHSAGKPGEWLPLPDVYAGFKTGERR